MQNTKRLSERLAFFANAENLQDMNVGHFISRLSERGHAFANLLLALPFITPIPLPGLSLAIGSIIALSGIFIMLGKPLWVPKWMAKKPLPALAVAKSFEWIITGIKKTEHVVRPRWSPVCDQAIVHFLASAVIILSGIILALPLPPGTNFPPAISIILVSWGLLEKDALTLFAGFAAFIVKIAVGIAAFNYLVQYFR